MATKIEWAQNADGSSGETWNPMSGCSIISPGCAICYAMRMAYRIEKMGGPPHYQGLTKVVNGNPVWTGKIAMASDKAVRAPLLRMKPTTYFVNSMSDLFHEDVPNEWIDRVFEIMQLTPWHRYQVLTKRAERMRNYLRKKRPRPLPNVWIGVSTERQKEADERIPYLVEAPAALRFLSIEPFLGPINLRPSHLSRIGWVIIGGESGPGARPFVLDDARVIVGMCQRAEVPVFVKQLGASPVFGPGEVRLKLKSRKGNNMDEWPADLRVREMPTQLELAA